MTIILNIQHLILQSAQGGGGGLLLVIFLIVTGILFFVVKRKTGNETQNPNDKNQGNFSLNTIVNYISRNKKPLTIGLIIVTLCIICIPLEISRAEDLQEDAYQEGYENGKKEGYERGYDKGYSQGENDGLSSGQRSGYSRGYRDQESVPLITFLEAQGVPQVAEVTGTGN